MIEWRFQKLFDKKSVSMSSGSNEDNGIKGVDLFKIKGKAKFKKKILKILSGLLNCHKSVYMAHNSRMHSRQASSLSEVKRFLSQI